jgi:polysaccharide biosynthesis/export protein
MMVFLSLAVGRARSQDTDSGQSGDDSGGPSSAPADDSGPMAPSPAGGGIVGPDYVIGPEDILEIEVFDTPELRQRVRVENDGSINVKLLGRVQAAGLTVQNLRTELQSDWGKDYLQDPQVSIFVREFHARPVTVIGAVEKPGVYQVPGSRSLMGVLAMAGGLAKRPAAGRTLFVTRKGGFGVLEPRQGLRQVAADQVEIDIPLLLYSHEERLNIPIKSFDTISVTRAGVVYVVGEVKKPGGFVLEDKEHISILQALALAEGLSPNAARKAARVIHRADDGTLSETPIDLSKILNGKTQDMALAADDVLFVPNSHAKYVAKRTAESVIGTLSGLIIFRGL